MKKILFLFFLLCSTNIFAQNVATTPTGVQPVSDNELLKIDYANRSPIRKARKLKTIGWIGGAVFTGVGATLFLCGHGNSPGIDNVMRICGGVTVGLGVAWTTTFLILANHAQKKTVQNVALLQEKILFKNGCSLMTGIDIIRDNDTNNSTLGLGVRYNF